MKHTRPIHFLLALAFVLGQWFAVVHSTQHELNAGDRLVACEVCATGLASGTAPLVLASSAGFPATEETPASPLLAAPSARLILRPPTRGPPRTLA